jgi:hypothetical protein
LSGPPKPRRGSPVNIDLTKSGTAKKYVSAKFFRAIIVRLGLLYSFI